MNISRLRESITLSPRQYDTSDLPDRYFNPGELDVLLHLFEGAEVIVEFGVNAGRNPAAALRNIPTLRRYVGVDVTCDYRTTLSVQRREVPQDPGVLARDDPRFELIVRPRGTFDLSSDDLPRADAVFIDADHSRVGVENDYALAKSIINPGGVIIFHDDNCRRDVEVTQTLNDFVEAGADIKHVSGTWIAFERF